MPSTPGGGADQRLRAHDETLWVVTDAGAPPTVRGLDANAGTGGDGVAVLGSWLREMCEPRASDAGTAAITDAAVDPNQGGRDDRRAVKAGINPGRRDGGAAGPRVRAEGKSGVTECARSGLDADTRALGAANGIVDLPTGEVLPATEGRATRVRVAAPHEYRPWPEHSADARADGDRMSSNEQPCDHAIHGAPPSGRDPIQTRSVPPQHGHGPVMPSPARVVVGWNPARREAATIVAPVQGVMRGAPSCGAVSPRDARDSAGVRRVQPLLGLRSTPTGRRRHPERLSGHAGSRRVCPRVWGDRAGCRPRCGVLRGVVVAGPRRRPRPPAPGLAIRPLVR